MRLFIAIDLPDSVKDAVAGLRADLPGAIWVKRQAFHLTLRFLGDPISEDRVESITNALATVRSAPFIFHLDGVGRFPAGNRRPARVLWVGVRASPALTALHAGVERAVRDVGFPPDDHAFRPHITLARFRSPAPSSALDSFLARYSAFQSEPIRVAEFILYSSALAPHGSLYTPLAKFRFE